MKRIRNGGVYFLTLSSILFFFILRIQNDLYTVLKPVSLLLDKRKRVTVLLPRMRFDLFDRLNGGLVQFKDGLRIVVQITAAFEDCWERGLHHVDLRISNVLVYIFGNPYDFPIYFITICFCF